MPGVNQISAMRGCNNYRKFEPIEKQQIISHFGIKRVIVQGA